MLECSQNVPLFQESPSLFTWGQGQFTEPHKPCAAQPGVSFSPAPSPAPVTPWLMGRGPAGHCFPEEKSGTCLVESPVLPWLSAYSQGHPPLCSPFNPKFLTSRWHLQLQGHCPLHRGARWPLWLRTVKGWHRGCPAWQGAVPEPGAAPMSPPSLGWPEQG